MYNLSNTKLDEPMFPLYLHKKNQELMPVWDIFVREFKGQISIHYSFKHNFWRIFQNTEIRNGEIYYKNNSICSWTGMIQILEILNNLNNLDEMENYVKINYSQIRKEIYFQLKIFFKISKNIKRFSKHETNFIKLITEENHYYNINSFLEKYQERNSQIISSILKNNKIKINILREKNEWTLYNWSCHLKFPDLIIMTASDNYNNYCKKIYLERRAFLFYVELENYRLLSNETNYLSRIIDYIDTVEEKCIITQYAIWGDLFNFIHRVKLSDCMKISVLKQIACGIREIHSRKLFHRDLKSQNVFVYYLDLNKETISVKISDFETVCNQDKETNEFIGTDIYRAPEVQNRQFYNNKIDIYSYGIIVFELFSIGKVHFSLENMEIFKYSMENDWAGIFPKKVKTYNI